MANIEQGIKYIEHIAGVLNDINIKTGKKIQKDNPLIWQDNLHKWENDRWQEMFGAFKALEQNYPEHFKQWDTTKFQNAVAVFNVEKMKHPRAMDRKNTKHHAWAMINTFREVWNRINKIDIKNEDQPQKPKKNKPRVTVEHTDEYTRTTIWHTHFQIED